MKWKIPWEIINACKEKMLQHCIWVACKIPEMKQSDGRIETLQLCNSLKTNRFTIRQNEEEEEELEEKDAVGGKIMNSRRDSFGIIFRLLI